MKRDMDLIRELLLKIEAGQNTFAPISSDMAAALGIPIEEPMSREAAERLAGHLELLEQGGLIEIEARMGAGTYHIGAITWAGHDFLDSVRDPKIWEKTKSGAEAAGGFTVDLLKDLAKGFIRKQVEEHTGVKL
jgi:hypothetical protein